MWTGFETVVNLVLPGILLDAVFQWVILGVSHPGAALVVGPVLIAGPYALARALSNRLARLRGRGRPETLSCASPSILPSIKSIRASG